MEDELDMQRFDELRSSVISEHERYRLSVIEHYKAHMGLAKHYRSLYVYIGVPKILLNAVLGTMAGYVSGAQVMGMFAEILLWCLIFLNIAAAALQSFSTFFNVAEQAEVHAAASKACEEFIGSADIQLLRFKLLKQGATSQRTLAGSMGLLVSQYTKLLANIPDTGTKSHLTAKVSTPVGDIAAPSVAATAGASAGSLQTSANAQPMAAAAITNTGAVISPTSQSPVPGPSATQIPNQAGPAAAGTLAPSSAVSPLPSLAALSPVLAAPASADRAYEAAASQGFATSTAFNGPLPDTALASAVDRPTQPNPILTQQQASLPLSSTADQAPLLPATPESAQGEPSLHDSAHNMPVARPWLPSSAAPPLNPAEHAKFVRYVELLRLEHAEYEYRISILAFLHRTAAEKFGFWCSAFGVPTVMINAVLSALAGKVKAGLSKDAELDSTDYSTLRVITGFNIAVAVLHSISEFFNFAQRNAQHLLAAQRCDVLKSEVDLQLGVLDVIALSDGSQDPQDALASQVSMKKAYAEMIASFPEVPTWAAVHVGRQLLKNPYNLDKVKWLPDAPGLGTQAMGLVEKTWVEKLQECMCLCSWDSSSASPYQPPKGAPVTESTNVARPPHQAQPMAGKLHPSQSLPPNWSTDVAPPPPATSGDVVLPMPSPKR